MGEPVSIHAPAKGGDFRGAVSLLGARRVSIHAPARGATRRALRGHPGRSCFDPRPARGATFISTVCAALLSVFDPRPREGGDVVGVQRILADEVSIHAPARGATDGLHGCAERLQVSIHAPARGATFLPLDHHGLVRVSIHAPARGATLGSISLCTLEINRPPVANATISLAPGLACGQDAHALFNSFKQLFRLRTSCRSRARSEFAEPR